MTSMQVPDGAQRSEDGHYWWDGNDWQPVPPGDQAGQPAPGENLPDDAFRLPSDIRDPFAEDEKDTNPPTLVDWSQYPTIKAVFDAPTGEDLLTALAVDAQAVQAEAPDACQRLENATWEMMSQTRGALPEQLDASAVTLILDPSTAADGGYPAALQALAEALRSAGDTAQAADKLDQAAQQLEQERAALLQTINQ